MSKMKRFPLDREWLLEMAKVEASCRSVAVGGLAADLGMIEPAKTKAPRVFGRLVRLARRAKRLSVEELARRADLDIVEVLDVEQHEETVPTPRTVYQLAQVLEIPPEKLTEVAGLAEPRAEVNKAALRFAARSEPTADLSAVEREALEEFVKVLGEASD